MSNISQSVTKVKEEVKNVAVGAAVLVPVAGLFYIINLLIDNGLLDKDLVSNFLLGVSILLVCWTAGGMVQAYNKWREYAKADQERRTLRAFEKLGKETSHEQRGL